jgi:hypothetical protein
VAFIEPKLQKCRKTANGISARPAIQRKVCGESNEALTQVPRSIALTFSFREKTVSTPSSPTFEMASIADRPREWEAVQADPRHPHPAAGPYLRLIATSLSTK